MVMTSYDSKWHLNQNNHIPVHEYLLHTSEIFLLTGVKPSRRDRRVRKCAILNSREFQIFNILDKKCIITYIHN